MIEFSDMDSIVKRLTECSSCENQKLGVCTKCGCIIQLKTRLADAECPIGKWGKAISDDKNITK